MTFNPRESIDFNGNTGPLFSILNARIPGCLRNRQKIDGNLGNSQKEIFPGPTVHTLLGTHGKLPAFTNWESQSPPIFFTGTLGKSYRPVVFWGPHFWAYMEVKPGEGVHTCPGMFQQEGKAPIRVSRNTTT